MHLKNRFKDWIPTFAGMTILVLLPLTTVFSAAPSVDIPPLDFKPAQVEQTTLSNGVKVYLKEDHELPLFDLNITMKTSQKDEPVLDAFVAMGVVWRTGGTLHRTPEQLNEELEFLPASVETSANEEAVSVSLSCLSKNWQAGLDILVDVLLNPVFDKEQLALTKAKVIEGLRRKNETPSQIARRAFRDVVYGKDHIYAHEPTEKGLEKITQPVLAQLHKRVTVPDAAVIALAGDFDREVVLKALEDKLKTWTPVGRFVPDYDFSIKSPSTGTVFFIEKEANQSRITIGTTGPTRHNPDHFSLTLADYILGGGGPSRLFGEIRSRLGYAYIVGSFVWEPKGPGLVGVGCQTKSQSTIAAVKALWVELDKFTAGPIQDKEIRLGKDALVNSFVFGFDSTWEVVVARMSNDFYGYPSDYLDTYTKRLELTSKEDIQKAAKKYFSKSKAKVMIVGQEKAFDAPLSDLGEVIRIPLKDVN